MSATAFRQLADDEIVEVRRSGMMTPERFVAGARAMDWRRACAEYLEAFPRAKFPEKVSPWWVMTAEAIRSRIASGKPYRHEDEPVIGKGGVLLTKGTDGEVKE